MTVKQISAQNNDTAGILKTILIRIVKLTALGTRNISRSFKSWESKLIIL